MSLISRKLLTPDEVLMIENPNAIVMIAGKSPVITVIPDISETYFNHLLGMGTEEQNQLLRIKREQARKERIISPIKIWNIWEKDANKEKIDIELIQDRLKRNLKGE